MEESKKLWGEIIGNTNNEIEAPWFNVEELGDIRNHAFRSWFTYSLVTA